MLRALISAKAQRKHTAEHTQLHENQTHGTK